MLLMLSADFFQIIFFKNTIRVSNDLDPGPGLGPKGYRQMTIVIASKERVNPGVSAIIHSKGCVGKIQTKIDLTS